MLAIALVAGGSLMCAPQAHAGYWDAKLDTQIKGTQGVFDSTTQTMRLDKVTFEGFTNFTSNVFGVSKSPFGGGEIRGYSSAGVVNKKIFNATVDYGVTYTLRMHWVASSATDLPPQLVVVQLNGTVGGYYTPTASGSMSGTTGLKDESKSDKPAGWLPDGRTVGFTGQMLAQYPNPKRDANITIGPFTATSTATAVPQSTQSTGYPGGSGSSTSTNATIRSYIAMSGALSQYGVYISSDLEPSYKKASNWSELPLQKDANGVDIPGTVDASQVSPSTPAFGAGGIRTSGPWGLVCKRNPDGSTTVESAAKYKLFSYWAGETVLFANPQGFPAPQYSWSLTSGGTLPFGGGSWTDPTYDCTGVENVAFDGSSSSLPTSSFTLKVTNVTPALSLSNNYSIKWHYPYEPYHKRPSIHQFTWRRALSDVDDGANFSLPGGNAESQQNPYQTEDSSFVPAARAGLGAADDLSSVFPKGKDVAEILTKFGGKALDWYVEKNFPTKSQHFTTIGEAWGYSIQHQQSGNSEGDDPAPIGGLVPSNLLSKPDGWLKCTHQVFEIVHSRRENWDADAYNSNGFVSDKGLVNADEALAVTVEVAFDQVRP